MVYIVLEEMICNGKTLSKNKAGKNVLLASRVFSRIRRDEVLKRVYLELCMEKGVDVVECMDSGPLIVRGALTTILKKWDGPVAEALRIASIRRLTQDEYYRFCSEICACYGEVVEHWDIPPWLIEEFSRSV